MLDLAPERHETLDDVLKALRATEKSIPTRLLYDARGSELFERICELEEYYLTRTELAILRSRIDEMTALIGSEALIVEYGSGSGLKTRLLLDHVERPAGYVPIEISAAALRESTARLTERYPDLDVLPVRADYLGEYELPRFPRRFSRRVVFFPGSTIGNFAREQAGAFLQHIGRTCGSGGGLLIGVDLHKDTPRLERAYDDAEGVTAEFELNALAHLNRDFDCEFDLDRFRYESFYNEPMRRIEMYLVSTVAQRVRLGDTSVEFREGERILVEYSLKFTLDDFARFAEDAGFGVERVWTDPDALFSVQYLSRR